MSTSGWRVMKFGGTSVADAARLRGVADLAAAALGEAGVCLVASAASGITDLLLRAARTAEAGGDPGGDVEAFRARHAGILADLAVELDGARRRGAEAGLQALGDEFAKLSSGVGLLRECPPTVRAHLSSLGERASCLLLVTLLEARGLAPVALDPRLLVRAHGDPLQAEPDLEATAEAFAAHRTGAARLLVLPGFFAGDAEGRTVLLGRGGSDYSAAIAASALKADLLEIWTDVDGIYSADPRQVPEAFALAALSFEEAMELSHFGAKVLHPKTIQPARAAGIPVRVRNSFRPDHAGTLITAQAPPPEHAARGLTLLEDVALLNVTGAGMKGVPGVAARTFQALAKEGINVLLITQGSSECAITLCVAGADGARAQRALKGAFELDLAAGRLDDVELKEGLSILSVVGEGMRARMGVAGTFFHALSEVGVNIVAIAQGSSERSISAVVRGADGPRGLRHAHRGFFGTAEVIELYLFGTGTVGGRLVEHLEAQKPRLKARGIELRLCGVARSKGLLLSEAGIDASRARDGLEGAGAPDPGRVVEFVAGRRPVCPVLVDCTSDEALAARYGECFAAGLHVVTANKKANAGSYATWSALREQARRGQRRFLYETNVGAGLPVISTLQSMLGCGDRVRRFEGILSGSLSFLLGRLEEGASFSGAVREAMAKGFTEPDPRDDLGGQDVGRKALILAREIGLQLEPSAVVVESLLPADFHEGSVADFLARLPELDAPFAARMADLRARGQVLRFLGSIDADGEAPRCGAGLVALDADHPLASVQGGENALAFLTDHYSPRPLVIRGYGAGADVTAAGVLSDILKLATWSQP
ncbi:MAG: bifunctional aspartate kinase/homoserine dehydrogenase I [Holophagaceae bacterium]